MRTERRRRESAAMLHAITVDVEDWYQSTIEPNADLSDRFVRSTGRAMEAFAKADVKGTFYILGLAAEKAPKLVKQICDAGHEVQSHGYGHLEVFKMSEQHFRKDVNHAKALLEDLTGQRITGYRSPFFSIDERTPWALDVLAETGHTFDSSIFPVKMRRYGVDRYPLDARIVTTERGNRIIEAPVAVFRLMGRRLPCGGGGYVRLLPYWFLRSAWRQIEREGRFGIFYMHPYEYDPSEMAQFRDSVSWTTRLHQGLGRKGFATKVARLLSDFRFGTMSEVIHPLLSGANDISPTSATESSCSSSGSRRTDPCG